MDLKLSSVIPSVYFTSSDKSISTKLRELEECIGISLSCLSLCVGHYICAQLTRLQVQSSHSATTHQCFPKLQGTLEIVSE